MKIDLIIISVILVLLVFLPFYLFPLIQNSGNKKIQKIFRKETEKYGLNIVLKERWNVNLIGIDTAQRKLILVQHLDDRFLTEFIDLRGVNQSKVVVTTIPVKKDGKTENVLQRVDLEFSLLYHDEKKLVNLYDYDLCYNQELEIMHAEKWNAHIQKYISSIPLKKTA